MVVMTWPRVSMEAFVDKLRRDYPALAFVPGKTAHWSARHQEVIYASSDSPSAVWTLLHELGHALLGHSTYDSDASLMQKEVEAWEKARQLGQKYNLIMGDDHIQQCLDTYREWLYKRSACPKCNSHGVQHSNGRYACLNCRTEWQVTSARFCRPYRLTKRS
jgi:hypothetical protein